jgi:hypothetical protein
MIMKQTVEEAAKKYSNDCRNRQLHCEPYCIVDFISGAEWQSKQSPWISVKEQLPEENENIIIMCKHGAIFNGSYCNGVWFCMDGYIYDTYKDSPIYSSMSSIPTLWKPIAYMPIPSFDEILEANKDVLQRLK